MLALQGETLLTAWDRYATQPENRRALTLLEVADEETDPEMLLDLPLAELNRRLLELRTISFGDRLEGFALCEACAAPLEFALNAKALAGQMSPAAAQTWTADGRTYKMRPATMRDLLACADTDEWEARTLLLSRVLTAGDEAAQNEALLLERFDVVNESAEIRLQLQCASCGHGSEFDLDVAEFLGRETAIAARHLLNDIHRLASAYGWGEQSILKMSSTRRSAYLAMLDA